MSNSDRKYIRPRLTEDEIELMIDCMDACRLRDTSFTEVAPELKDIAGRLAILRAHHLARKQVREWRGNV